MSTEPDPARGAPSLLYSVKQVELAIRSHLDELLRPTGITTTQYTALTVLGQRDGLSSAELARLSFVTAQSMGDLVTGLEQRGLIRRERDPANRRRLLITMTPAGHAVLAAQLPAIRTLERLMLSGLRPDDVEAFRDALSACRAALTTDPTQQASATGGSTGPSFMH
jgi:DNA-binding MarR family transcriptional regulator